MPKYHDLIACDSFRKTMAEILDSFGDNLERDISHVQMTEIGANEELNLEARFCFKASDNPRVKPEYSDTVTEVYIAFEPEYEGGNLSPTYKWRLYEAYRSDRLWRAELLPSDPDVFDRFNITQEQRRFMDIIDYMHHNIYRYRAKVQAKTHSWHDIIQYLARFKKIRHFSSSSE